MVCMVAFESQMPSVMSVREGDRIYVVERINQDWWFVRKKITNKFGFVPAEAMTDTVSYTHYIGQSVDKQINKLSNTECKLNAVPYCCSTLFQNLSKLLSILDAELTVLI